jgi:hypothetical protein
MRHYVIVFVIIPINQGFNLIKAVQSFVFACDISGSLGRDRHPTSAHGQADLDCDMATIKAKIGSSAFEAADDSGQGIALDEVVALALNVKKGYSCLPI